VQSVGQFRCGSPRTRLVLEPVAQPAAALTRAPLIGDDSQGDPVEPRQRLVGDEVAAAPDDGEGLGCRVLGRRPVRQAADRKGENRRIVVAEAALEVAIGVRQGSGLIAGGGIWG
jgi:hypothetical protein